MKKGCRKKGCSEYVKGIGIKSLKHFSEVTGVPVTTLRDWYTTKNKQFNLLALGVISFESPDIPMGYKLLEKGKNSVFFAGLKYRR